jgi:hypothetical protein
MSVRTVVKKNDRDSRNTALNRFFEDYFSVKLKEPVCVSNGTF